MLRATRQTRRAGYTWTELIVVLVSVNFLAGLLVLGGGCGPGEPARRTQCINNHHNIGISLIRYEGEKNRYPGWTNNQNPDKEKLGGTETGWVFPILPYLDRSDIFNHYGSSGKEAGEQPKEHLKILVCPNDSDIIGKGTNMSYVVNTGFLDDESPEKIAAGVFTRQYRTAVDQKLAIMNTGAIIDGVAMTLMVGENLDAGTWNSAKEGCVGFTWQEGTPEKGARINELAGTGECKFARPSSKHSGGAVFTFCDGHTQFISEDIDYTVYQRLMTSRGKAFDQGPIVENSY
jgi:prepilin-type processing-associated H-X9-DG protein